MNNRKFETVTGQIVEVDVSEDQICRHDHILQKPIWVSMPDVTYECQDCGMLFNESEFAAIASGS